MIGRKDVEHIARLARIALTEAEKEKLEKDLSGILEFVAKLNELDVSEVEPMTGGTTLKNAMRDDADEVALPGCASPSLLVEVSPTNKNGYVGVKSVFDRT